MEERTRGKQKRRKEKKRNEKKRKETCDFVEATEENGEMIRGKILKGKKKKVEYEARGKK